MPDSVPPPKPGADQAPREGGLVGAGSESAAGRPNAGLVYEVPQKDGEVPIVLAAAQGTAPDLRFVTANDLKMLVIVERRSTVAETAGVRIGVASVHGRILSIITLLGTLGDRRRDGVSHAALLCETDGGPAFLLDGGRVCEVGAFAPAGEGAVRFGDERVTRLDTTAFYRSIEKRVWERSALVPHVSRIARGKEGALP